MDSRERKWFATGLAALKNQDRQALVNVFTSLSSFFDRSVGVWFIAQGTTDANGELTFNHNASFVPSVVQLTSFNDGVSTHNDGPFHLDHVDKTSITVHCLDTTSGGDAANVFVKFHVLCLP